MVVEEDLVEVLEEDMKDTAKASALAALQEAWQKEVKAMSDTLEASKKLLALLELSRPCHGQCF